MALSVIAHPITAMQASAISESEQTTLFWRFSSSVAEQPAIACWVVQGASRPGAFRAARRIFSPRLDSRQGTRLDADIVFLGTTLKTDAHSSIDTASLYGMDRCRVRYAPQLKGDSVAKAEDINRACFRRQVCLL